MLTAMCLLIIALPCAAGAATTSESQTSPPAPSADEPPAEQVAPLRRTVADLADVLAAFGKPHGKCLLSRSSQDSLLAGYVAHMITAHLSRRGVDAARAEDLPGLPAVGVAGRSRTPPDESLSKRLSQALGASGATLFVQVAAEAQEGERHLLVWAYDVSSGRRLTRVRSPFHLPAELEALAAGKAAPMEDSDRKWLVLFEEMFAARPAENPGRDLALVLAEGDYFIETGLWAEAARVLLDAAEPTPNRSFMRAVFSLQLAGEPEQLEEASSQVQSVLKRYPDSGPLHALWAWLQLRQKRPDDALMLLEQALIWGMAREGLYRYARGLMAVEQHDDQAAEQALTRAAELLPDGLFAQLELARLHWKRGDLDKALERYRQATRTGKCTADTWAELAVALEAANDVDGAIQALRQAFHMRSDSLLITRRLAFLLKRKGQYEEALKVLRRAAEANPCRPALLAAYGDGAAEMWRMGAAEKAFNESIGFDGEHAYGQVRLAAMLAVQRRYREAQRLLTDLLGRQPDYHPARFELGRIRGELEHTEEAISLLTEATKSPEHEASARLAMAEVYLRAGQPEDAITSAQIAVSCRADGETYAALSRAFLANGEPAKAETTAASAVKSDPLSAAAHLALARSLAANEKPDPAQAEVARALELYPYFVQALQFSGSLRLAAGDFRGCAELWQKALALNPWDAELHFELAKLLREKLKDREGALEHHNRGLELDDMRRSAAQ